MTVSFTKYHGTGNDFIMIDCTVLQNFKITSEQISKLCHRRFGIGADGVILIFKNTAFDFSMDYYNPDGSQSFCGNGARCAVHFAHSLQLFKDKAIFKAIDGIHEATFENDLISLKMNDVNGISKEKDDYIIHTGSPHYIKFLENIHRESMVEFGKKIRHSPKYNKEGINVNLVEILSDNLLEMRTYERGVEDETYSCGTGATAVALGYADLTNQKEIAVEIIVKGGKLHVKAQLTNDGFKEIYLIGPATETFKGEVEIL